MEEEGIEGTDRGYPPTPAYATDDEPPAGNLLCSVSSNVIFLNQQERVQANYKLMQDKIMNSN